MTKANRYAPGKSTTVWPTSTAQAKGPNPGVYMQRGSEWCTLTIIGCGKTGYEALQHIKSQIEDILSIDGQLGQQEHS